MNVGEGSKGPRVYDWTVGRLGRLYDGPFEVVSIDTEGLDDQIVHACVDHGLFDQWGTRVVCVEFGSNLQSIQTRLVKCGFQPARQTDQNIIMAKRK